MASHHPSQWESWQGGAQGVVSGQRGASRARLVAAAAGRGWGVGAGDSPERLAALPASRPLDFAGGKLAGDHLTMGE